MAKSYNGWSASQNPGNFGGLADLIVAGESFAPGVRAGDVHTVFQYVAEQLHARVEPVVRSDWHQADDWGYAYRKNRNANNLSCHASGTAIDYNATRHPNGVSGTFSREQFNEIDRILFEVDNVVKQLRGYDEMHFEINGSAGEVSRVAARLRGGDVPKGPSPAPNGGERLLVYREGEPMMEGNDVKDLQRVLNAWYPWLNLDVDGWYGPATRDAVIELQTRAGIEVDGVVGPQTRAVLGL